MPLAATFTRELAQEHVTTQLVSLARAHNIDFLFLKDIILKDGTPEYSGYNTRVCYETGMTQVPKSAYSYQPLINMKPSDPTTVFTSNNRGFELTQDANQNILLITADAAIYKIIVYISFQQPDLHSNMVALLGGMYLLMDFVPCIGTFMTDCGRKKCSGFSIWFS